MGGGEVRCFSLLPEAAAGTRADALSQASMERAMDFKARSC